MKSFADGFIEGHPIDQAVLRTVGQLGVLKGKQGLFKQQAPQVLETLRKAALIESTEASNRIEGVTAEFGRLQALVEHRDGPANRSEAEIAGYRDVLTTIHVNHERMDFTPNLILQLHRDLYQFVPSEGGRWKPTDNQIAETLQDGSVHVRFVPVSAVATPHAMEELHRRLNERWHEESIEPLLLTGTYVLDFLCIHPFRDGNGRMARLLTLLLLYRAGYEAGRYISLERLIERTSESYYQSLYDSSQGWHSGEHSLLPWWNYFLGVVLAAHREFETRVGAVTTRRGAKTQMVVDAVSRLPGTFRVGDVRRACPGVSQPTIHRALAELRRKGRLACVELGRNATWRKDPGQW